ncbi:hypothetical protein Dimus_017665, partial [Dionaea muscipula]
HAVIFIPITGSFIGLAALLGFGFHSSYGGDQQAAGFSMTDVVNQTCRWIAM